MKSLLRYCAFNLIFIPVSYSVTRRHQVHSKEGHETFQEFKDKEKISFIDYDSEYYPKIGRSLKLFNVQVPTKRNKEQPLNDEKVQRLSIQKDQDHGSIPLEYKESKGKGPALLKFPQGRYQQSQKIDSHWSDLSPVNPHYSYPSEYSDFGRRFVLLYPYSQKNQTLPHVAEDEENDIIQAFQKDETDVQDNLVPMEAPPEFVLAVAKQSALLEASKPANPTDEIIQKDILRSGNYWNAVWEEHVDRKMIMRTNNKKVTTEKKFPTSAKLNLIPDRKIPEVISILKQMSPRFIYVLSNKDENNY